MKGNEEKRSDVLALIEEQIKFLTSVKKTGKYKITVEINLTDGGIGEIFLDNQSREKILG